MNKVLLQNTFQSTQPPVNIGFGIRVWLDFRSKITGNLPAGRRGDEEIGVEAEISAVNCEITQVR